MRSLAESSVCEGRKWCDTCRNPEAGRVFRQSLGSLFALPEGAPDFACPHGLPWNLKTAPAPVIGLGDWIQQMLVRLGIHRMFKRLQKCGCEKRQLWLNRFKLRTRAWQG